MIPLHILSINVKTLN